MASKKPNLMKNGGTSFNPNPQLPFKLIAPPGKEMEVPQKKANLL